MFINDIFKKKLNESLRDGEYYTFRVFFDDGTDETLNFSSDDIDWDRVGAKRDKKVVDVKRLGGIQGSQSDSPRKPHDFPDDRGLARAQRAYDRQLPEGGFDIPEIPRAPTPKPPKEKDIAEAHGPYGKIKPGDLEKIQKAKEREKKNAPGQLRRALPPSKQRYRDSSIEYFAKLDEQDVEEGSAQDRLHRRHQELRKKSGLPDPDYYKELKASYDIEDDAKRLAHQAEIKKKYKVAEGSLEEYGDTDKGQKKLAKVHHRAADRVTSKKADRDPAYARKAQQTQDRAWERLAVKEQGVAEAKTKRSAYKGSAGAQAIAQASGVKNVNRIVPGQQLNIPGQATPYVVQKGDTLDAIARRFSAPAAAMEPTFTGMAGRPDPTFTGMAGSEFTGISQAPAYTGRGMSGSEFTGITQADTLPSFTGMAGSEKDAKIAARTDTFVDTDGLESGASGFNFVNKEPTNEQGVAEAVDIGQEWISDTELDQYVPAHLQQQWRELFGYDEDGNPSALWANLTGGYEPDVQDPQHRALMVKVANKWFAAKKIPNVRFFDVKDAVDELEWLVQIGEQGVAEAGPFSYGAKKPRKGSVADLAAKKRKEQERGKQPIEPRDQMVGTARVIKNVTEGKQVASSWQITFKDGKKKEFKADHEQGSGPSNSQILMIAQAQNPNKQVASVKQQYTPNAKTTKINRVEKSGRVDWSDRDSQGAYYITKEAVNEDIERYLDEMHRAGYDIVTERATLCPECGGVAYEDKMLAEKQDACYHKVKSRYKVWPSAYASGALVRCRKKGAKNWGNKSKK